MVDNDFTTVYQEYSKHLIKGAKAYFVAREALAKNEHDFSSILIRQTNSKADTSSFITPNFATVNAELNELTQASTEDDYLTLRETIVQLMHIASWSNEKGTQLKPQRRKKLEQLLSEFSAACATPENLEPKTTTIDDYTFSEEPVIDKKIINKHVFQNLDKQTWFTSLEPTRQQHYRQQAELYLNENSSNEEKQQASLFLFNHSPLLADIPSHRAFVKTSIKEKKSGFSFTEYRAASNVCREIRDSDERKKQTVNTIKGKIRCIKENRDDDFSVNGISPGESYKPILLFKSNYVELGNMGPAWATLTGQTDEDALANEERAALEEVKQDSEACANYELLRCGHSFLAPSIILGAAFKAQTEQKILFDSIFEHALTFFDEATYTDQNTNEKMFFSDEMIQEIKSIINSIKIGTFNKALYKRHLFNGLTDKIQNHIHELILTLNEYALTFNRTLSCPQIYDHQHYTLSGLEAYATYLLAGDVLTECKTGRNRSVVQGNWGKAIAICIHEGTINRRSLKYWFGRIFHNAPHRESVSAYLPGSGRFRKNLARLLPQDFIQPKHRLKSLLSTLAKKLKITDAFDWLRSQFHPEKQDRSIAIEKKADYALTADEVQQHERGSSMARLKEQKKTPSNITKKVSIRLQSIRLTIPQSPSTNTVNKPNSQKQQQKTEHFLNRVEEMINNEKSDHVDPATPVINNCKFTFVSANQIETQPQIPSY